MFVLKGSNTIFIEKTIVFKNDETINLKIFINYLI